jgi:hypothetical protein
MAEYLACQNATQRARTIRAAKFPKKVEVAAYRKKTPPKRGQFTGRSNSP